MRAFAIKVILSIKSLFFTAMCMHAASTHNDNFVNLLPSLPTAQHMRMHAIIFSNFISPPLSSSGRRRLQKVKEPAMK